jgi:hypothetical protein
MGQIAEFFERIYGDATGRMTLVLPNYAGKPVNEKWYSWPEDKELIEQTVDENSNRDVWYSPQLFDEDRRLKENSSAVATLGADADSCDPQNFRVPPSLVIETSPGSYQVYWKLSHVADPNETSKINRRIAQVHKDQGCDVAFVNAAKLMRVPNTGNSKHPGARVIVSEIDDDVEYDIEYFDEVYPVSEVPDAQEFASEAMPEGLAEFTTDSSNRVSLMRGLPNSASLNSLLMDNWVADKRSHMRWRLLCELYRLNLPDEAVMALAWWAPSNKYRTDTDERRGVKGLWDEAVKAKNTVASGLEKAADDEDYEYDWGDGEEKTVEEKTERTDFLTAEERSTLMVNFIDEWVTWAATKTDAPSEYHRAAAITLLSIIYSEFAHAFPRFGELKLNIWMMVLGRSTKDRKTTSRSYLEKALRALKTDTYDYNLGDDVTPGGISLALHDRAHKASLFSRDEVQGLFKEVLSQGYMAGGLEVFTKLYDGWSGGRIRASGEKKILLSVPVSFVMFMMGILSESTEVLTVTNYRSGFLTRFVYVIGSRPEGYEAPPLEQGDDKHDGEDLVFNGLTNHLAANRAFWETRPDVNRDEGITHRFMADEDAWKRFQEFQAAADKAANNSQYAEVIGTTTERMQITVLKLAALLAMDERSVKIKMRHMLSAISYAGEWFDNAVKVASMVSESEWQRNVDDLEKFINSKGGKTSYAMAYRNFPGKKAFEFEEMVVALERRGILNRVPNGNKFVLELEYKE